MAVVGCVALENEVELNPKSSFFILGTKLGWSVSYDRIVIDAFRL